ncbi:MAG: zinc-binding dehydrogenase [Trueperaceae bacterium]|nr:MAG: zinc-binding dehydrogenase [Trueperaceae bacterium]
MAATGTSTNIYFTGRDLVEVHDEPLPKLQPHEVRIKARKTLISTGTEGICLTRSFEPGTHWDQWVQYPFSPGYSLVGEIVELGSDVATVDLGSRVAVRKPHHQYVTAGAEALFPIPENVTDDDATFFALGKIVQNGVRRAEHVLGEQVVVVGLGLLGQLVVQYCRLMGARDVIAIDLSASRLELACKHGATAGLQESVTDALEEVMQLTAGRGADTVYDVTGSAKVLLQALPLVKRFGTLVLLGDTGTPSEQRLSHRVVTQGLRIVGAHDSNPPPASSDHAFWDHQQMTQLFFRYLARGDLKVADLISHRYRPQEAPQAYEMLQRDRLAALGVLFDWEVLDGR